MSNVIQTTSDLFPAVANVWKATTCKEFAISVQLAENQDVACFCAAGGAVACFPAVSMCLCAQCNHELPEKCALLSGADVPLFLCAQVIGTLAYNERIIIAIFAVAFFD